MPDFNKCMVESLQIFPFLFFFQGKVESPFSAAMHDICTIQLVKLNSSAIYLVDQETRTSVSSCLIETKNFSLIFPISHLLTLSFIK